MILRWTLNGLLLAALAGCCGPGAMLMDPPPAITTPTQTVYICDECGYDRGVAPKDPAPECCGNTMRKHEFGGS